MQNFFYKSSTDFPWENNSYVKTEHPAPQLIRILANKEGLLSLSEHLKKFAESNDPSYCYEVFPGDLEEGSIALEIVKIECPGRKNYK